MRGHPLLYGRIPWLRFLKPSLTRSLYLWIWPEPQPPQKLPHILTNIKDFGAHWAAEMVDEEQHKDIGQSHDFKSWESLPGLQSVAGASRLRASHQLDEKRRAGKASPNLDWPWTSNPKRGLNISTTKTGKLEFLCLIHLQNIAKLP